MGVLVHGGLRGTNVHASGGGIGAGGRNTSSAVHMRNDLDLMILYLISQRFPVVLHISRVSRASCFSGDPWPCDQFKQSRNRTASWMCMMYSLAFLLFALVFALHVFLLQLQEKRVPTPITQDLRRVD